jgi:hypothetical protein
MSVVIIGQTTAATYEVKLKDGETRYYKGYGFSGADAIALEAMTTEDTYVAESSAGSAITLTSSNTSYHLHGPFIGRWSKGTTTGSVGLREQA